jgi:hypothetical protein
MWLQDDRLQRLPPVTDIMIVKTFSPKSLLFVQKLPKIIVKTLTPDHI